MKQSRKIIKKALVFIAMLCVTYVCSGQIELLKNVNGQVFPTISEDEFYSLDFENLNQIVIYDANMNVKKTISINGIEVFWVSNVGKNIYTNSGKYEFLLFGRVSEDDNDRCYFCNEDSEFIYLCNNDGQCDMLDYAYKSRIVRNKLIIPYDEGSKTKVYSLYGNVSKIADHKSSQSKAYPNPATSNIKIQYTVDKMDIMTIYDISGKIIESVFLSPSVNEIEIQVSNYSQGVYIYKYKDVSGKFIVQ